MTIIQSSNKVYAIELSRSIQERNYGQHHHLAAGAARREFFMRWVYFYTEFFLFFTRFQCLYYPCIIHTLFTKHIFQEKQFGVSASVLFITKIKLRLNFDGHEYWSDNLADAFFCVTKRIINEYLDLVEHFTNTFLENYSCV